MKRILLTCLVSVLTIALASPAMVAAKSEEANFGLGGIVGQAGNSNNSFMKLFEKDDTDWSIVDGGARGKLKYSLTETTFDFHFNGHGLEFESEYALIYYPDPWPGTGLIVFGTDVADEEGNVHIKGSADIEGILPAEGDTNVGEEGGGVKIWLVLFSDVGEGAMAGWTPDEYLFEYDLIPVAAEIETVTTEAKDGNQDNPNKPDKPDKPDKSNNGKGNNK